MVHEHAQLVYEALQRSEGTTESEDQGVIRDDRDSPLGIPRHIAKRRDELCDLAEVRLELGIAQIQNTADVRFDARIAKEGVSGRGWSSKAMGPRNTIRKKPSSTL